MHRESRTCPRAPTGITNQARAILSIAAYSLQASHSQACSDALAINAPLYIHISSLQTPIRLSYPLSYINLQAQSRSLSLLISAGSLSDAHRKGYFLGNIRLHLHLLTLSSPLFFYPDGMPIAFTRLELARPLPLE